MRVECYINNILNIDNEDTLNRIKKYICLSDGQLNLTVKKTYIVYGVVFRDNAPWYYVCVSDDDECPTAYPAELFNVVDDNIPHNWRLSYRNFNGQLFSELVISEWAKDCMFYENLVEGAKKESDIFKAEKNKQLESDSKET